MNGQIDYQSSDYSTKYPNQNSFYSGSHQPNITVHHGQYPQQQYSFNQQYTNYYPSQYDYSFSQIQNQQISSVQTAGLAQAPSITPPPSNTNTPTPLYANSSHYQQLLADKKNKNMKPSRCLTNLLSKKETDDFHKSDEDEDDEDEDLSDEEDEEDSRFDSLYKHKKPSDMDTENDYEIKHNCLSEQGAYMNSLFNSPSSLSSQSGKARKAKKQENMVVTKMERSDVNETSLAQYGQENQQQQHINNMINSYNLAGIMNDYDLVNLPLRELNKRLRFLPKQMAYNMKKRRRTLKNRKYAQNCRSKRLEQKSEMEIQNSQLKVELQRLNKLTEKLQQENSYLRSCLNSNSGKSLDDMLDSGKTMSSMCHSDSNSLPSSSTPLTPTTPTNCNQLTQLLSLPPAHYNSLHSHQTSFNNIHITK